MKYYEQLKFLAYKLSSKLKKHVNTEAFTFTGLREIVSSPAKALAAVLYT
jgi:hypothetical protein